MDATDKIVHGLFSTRWTGDLCNSPVSDMKVQLYKNLQNQLGGYWSGHTAYYIMVDGGFLIDSKRIYDEDSNRCFGKKLTALGEIFMEEMNNDRTRNNNRTL